MILQPAMLSHHVPSYPTNLIEFPRPASYRWKKNILVLVSRVFRTDPLLGPSNPGPANHICFQRRGRGMCHSEYPGCFHKQVPRYPQCSHQYTWLLWKFIPQNNGRSSNETHCPNDNFWWLEKRWHLETDSVTPHACSLELASPSSKSMSG